jgi:hypothetical protein
MWGQLYFAKESDPPPDLFIKIRNSPLFPLCSDISFLASNAAVDPRSGYKNLGLAFEKHLGSKF